MSTVVTLTLDMAVLDAYAIYDADPRTNGPDDSDAFRDAVRGVVGDFVEDWIADEGSEDVIARDRLSKEWRHAVSAS